MVKRCYVGDGIPTLALALAEHMNADELKVLASLTRSPTPTRKADLVDHILDYLEGDRLRTIWQSLDEIQKAAVADDMVFFSRYDGLLYFRINGLGAYCVGTAESYAPAPMEVKPVLRVLPNLEVAAIGAELEHGDRLALDCYAERTSDVVWKLEATKLLSATEEGRTIGEIREFLSARSGAPLPETVMRLLEDVADRSARIHDHGLARLLECAEPALAALIANDTRTRRHCMRAGERHLVVPAASEAAFRRGLRELGYLVAHGHAQARAAARPTATDVAGRQAAEA